MSSPQSSSAEGDAGPPELSTDPIAHVHEIVRRSGSSFAGAMRVLGPEKRDAMFAVYAFCREVDDIADEPAPVDEKLLRLGQWRGEIERLFAGRPRVPTAVVLAGPVERFGLRKEDFRAVIDGMEMDAVESLRIKDIGELELYCDRVASAVGRLSCRVFEVDEENGEMLARTLGQALQLTNILRDLGEDAERDRLYLPADLLHAHGIDALTPLATIADPAVGGVCEIIADIARRRYEEAAETMANCPRDRVKPAMMMMQAYRRILDRLIRRGWEDWRVPVGLSRLEKLWIVLRYGLT
jgi:squalene synthase HpnD